MDPEPDERYVGEEGGGGVTCMQWDWPSPSVSRAVQCVFAQAGMIGMSTPACL